MPTLTKKPPYPDFGVWLTYAEAVHSATAIAHGIDNTPSAAQYACMVYTYQTLYAPLCEWCGAKIPVNSFFRCEAVNDLVPGASSTSGHVKGESMDLDCQQFSNPLTNSQLFERIRTSGLVYDQLIFEAPDKNNVPRWIHVAARQSRPRRMTMKMVRLKKGGVDYIHWPFRVSR